MLEITWLFLLEEKSELGHIFRKFNTVIQTQIQTKVQVLKTDNAREHFETSLEESLDSQDGKGSYPRRISAISIIRNAFPASDVLFIIL